MTREKNKRAPLTKEEQAFVIKHKKLVPYELNRFLSNRNGSGRRYYDDLIQEGYLGLMRAAQKYDEELGKPTTYCKWWIHQSFLRAVRTSCGNDVKIPNYQYEQMHRILRERRAHDSWESLIDSALFTEDEIAEIRSYGQSYLYLDEPYYDEDSLDGYDRITVGSGDDPLNQVIRKQSRRLADYIVAGLDLSNGMNIKNIYRWRMNGEKLSEIGKKINRSRERVRQIEAIVIDTIQDVI